jgi:hypothetical protein
MPQLRQYVVVRAKSLRAFTLMHLSAKKPCTPDHILRTGLSPFKGSFRKNALEARWNLPLRAVRVPVSYHSSVEASIHEQYTV